MKRLSQSILIALLIVAALTTVASADSAIYLPLTFGCSLPCLNDAPTAPTPIVAIPAGPVTPAAYESPTPTGTPTATPTKPAATATRTATPTQTPLVTYSRSYQPVQEAEYNIIDRALIEQFAHYGIGKYYDSGELRFKNGVMTLLRNGADIPQDVEEFVLTTCDCERVR